MSGEASPRSGLLYKTYEEEVFFRRLRRVARPVFGQGWVVTKAQVEEAFFAADPENTATILDKDLFDTFVWEALKSEVEGTGLKVLDA